MLDLDSSTDMKLLPLVFLLTRPGITSADETGFISVSEGADAVLPCSLTSKQNIEKMVFDWKKDQREVFLYDRGQHYNTGRAGQDKQFEGRVSHFEDELKFGNASIRIHRTQLSDNGSYTCTFPDTQKSHIMLYVGAASEPSVRILNITKEGTLLLCVVRDASPKPDVIWQDGTGNIISSQKPQITERGGSYNILLLTTVTKTDHYRCTVIQKELKHQVSAETLVQINEIPTGWIIGVVVPCALLLLVMVSGVVLVLLFAKGHLIVKLKPGQISNLESAHLNCSSSSGKITHQNP